MIRFYYHPTPNPAKIALFLEETGLPYEAVPVDTSKGQQHTAEFRAINPNGKVPAIVDTDGPGDAEVASSIQPPFCSISAEKTGQLMGSPADRGELLSWLFYIATGLGPFSGQAVHFQRAAPEKLPYAINRYRREAERHYAVLDKHLEGRELHRRRATTRSPTSRPGAGSTAPASCCPAATIRLPPIPNIRRWFHAINDRPAVAKARAVGSGHAFKKEVDDETRRALFPSNYPPAAA